MLKQALPAPLNMDTYDANEVEEAMLEEIDLDELGKGQGAAGGDSHRRRESFFNVGQPAPEAY